MVASRISVTTPEWLPSRFDIATHSFLALAMN
jgi:hypothetical protein